MKHVCTCGICGSRGFVSFARLCPRQDSVFDTATVPPRVVSFKNIWLDSLIRQSLGRYQYETPHYIWYVHSRTGSQLGHAVQYLSLYGRLASPYPYFVQGTETKFKNQGTWRRRCSQSLGWHRPLQEIPIPVKKSNLLLPSTYTVPQQHRDR